MAKKRAAVKTGLRTKVKLTQLEKELAKRLKALRIKAGYNSAEKFANDKGLNRSQWGSYEKLGNPTVKSLERICKALGITIGELFGEGFGK